MNEYLPYAGFNLYDTNIDVWNKYRIMSMDDEANDGANLEVDIHIPENLHDQHEFGSIS